MPSRRKESYTEVDIKCPFYLNDNRKNASITCEGHCDNMDCVSKFTTLKERDKYIGVYCISKYERCPIHNLAMKKYE